MSKHYSRAALQSVAAEIPAEALRPNRAERAFGLHPALFVATIAAYFSFLAIMGAAFINAELAIPFAICVVYFALFFGVPGLWARLVGRPEGRLQTWAEFREEGMIVATGHISSGGAIAQVMVLPVLIVGFAAATAVIVALV